MQMRIRTIKPDFHQHGGLYDAEVEAQLPLRVAYSGLWCAADREGRFEWKPRELKLNVLPYDPVDMGRVLDALASRGFVVRYAERGREYGWIPSFLEHQSINNREQPSKLPPPPPEVVTAVEDGTYAYESRPWVTREPRVDDASARVEDAPSGEQNRTEQNRGEPKELAADAAKPLRIRRGGPVASWVADLGALWEQYRGEPNYGRIGKVCAPLIRKHGKRQVAAVFHGYLEAKDDKDFCTLEDFAANYNRHRTTWGQEIAEDGCTWHPIPDEPEGQAA